ncbi:MAG: YeeE/YedE family protein, partial [Planctomycetes bacterium]|nr:YeeE/YedE family protein [Planctomycetota bacterium]
QASLRGILSPPREWLSRLGGVDGAARDLLAPLPSGSGLLLGLGILVAGGVLARRHRLHVREWAGAVSVGACIPLGWYLTHALSLQSFEPIAVQSVTFTGPSADTLMALVNEPSLPFDFGIGLVVGVFAGSLVASVAGGEFRLQGFDTRLRMPRYLVGAGLMGFGGMLAGGCAVGSGVTGGSVFALTAWVALLAMWLSAGVTDRLVERATDREPGDSAAVVGR